MHRTLTLAILLAIAALLPASGAESIRLGPPETVLADQALGLRAFPDGALAVLQTKPKARVILAAGISSVLLEGPDISKLNKSTTVLQPGKTNEFDNGYAGISSVVPTKTGELLAFYHAEDQEGMTTIGGGIPGFYCRVAMASSRDDGVTFEKRGPILSGHAPKNPKGLSDQGVGEPWVMPEPSKEYLYAYYTAHERLDGRGVDICIARCLVKDALTPGKWQKLYQGKFEEPGLGGKDTPVITGGLDADAIFPQVFYLPKTRQFVMTFCINAWKESGNADRSGIYVAFSDDGIRWPRERLQQIWKVPVVAREGQEVAWHPTFVSDEADATRGWLYYSYSENWGWTLPAKPHYLARRRMEIGTPATK